MSIFGKLIIFHWFIITLTLISFEHQKVAATSVSAMFCPVCQIYVDQKEIPSNPVECDRYQTCVARQGCFSSVEFLQETTMVADDIAQSSGNFKIKLETGCFSQASLFKSWPNISTDMEAMDEYCYYTVVPSGTSFGFQYLKYTCIRNRHNPNRFQNKVKIPDQIAKLYKKHQEGKREMHTACKAGTALTCRTNRWSEESKTLESCFCLDIEILNSGEEQKQSQAKILEESRTTAADTPNLIQCNYCFYGVDDDTSSECNHTCLGHVCVLTYELRRPGGWANPKWKMLHYSYYLSCHNYTTPTQMTQGCTTFDSPRNSIIDQSKNGTRVADEELASTTECRCRENKCNAVSKWANMMPVHQVKSFNVDPMIVVQGKNI